VPAQTDTSPYNTSTGERVSDSGVAISQDRLCKACRRLHKRCKEPSNPTAIHYGDCLFIEDVGFRIVNDCMGKRQHWRIKTKKGYKVLFKKQLNWLDVWVPKYRDEHNFHRQFGINKHKIWLIKEIK
jgi:hypothetical protein